MKTKVFELQGPALDWAVAKCEQGDFMDKTWWSDFGGESCYSTDWAQGGPIIERCGMDVVRRASSDGDFMWLAYRPEARGVRLCATRTGPTPLIAAMRCYVESELGDEVDVPNELQGEKA